MLHKTFTAIITAATIFGINAPTAAECVLANQLEMQNSSLKNKQEFISANIQQCSSENLQSAESTYQDADMAKEMTEFTRNNILLQTATSMLSQGYRANQRILQR